MPVPRPSDTASIDGRRPGVHAVPAARGGEVIQGRHGPRLPGPAPHGTTRLCLLGGPYILLDGQKIGVPEGGKRLLAYVALHSRAANRRQVGGTLWPNGDDERAAGNLRSALWRLRTAGIDLLETGQHTLALRPSTEVDVDDLRSWADRVLAGTAEPVEWRVPDWDPEAPTLLPGWYDDWVLVERERLRQRLLHALEAVSRWQLSAGRYSDAIDTAMRTIEVDPLRETAQRTLIAAHVGEGNLAEARRAYEAYRAVLDEEIGLPPSPELGRLLSPASPAATPDEAEGCPMCRGTTQSSGAGREATTSRGRSRTGVTARGAGPDGTVTPRTGRPAP